MKARIYVDMPAHSSVIDVFTHISRVAYAQKGVDFGNVVARAMIIATMLETADGDTVPLVLWASADQPALTAALRAIAAQSNRITDGEVAAIEADRTFVEAVIAAARRNDDRFHNDPEVN